jgi:hypothetical protein
MLFVIRMLCIGWRVQAKRDWASSPNGWVILRLSANGNYLETLTREEGKSWFELRRSLGAH